MPTPNEVDLRLARDELLLAERAEDHARAALQEAMAAVASTDAPVWALWTTLVGSREAEAERAAQGVLAAEARVAAAVRARAEAVQAVQRAEAAIDAERRAVEGRARRVAASHDPEVVALRDERATVARHCAAIDACVQAGAKLQADLATSVHAYGNRWVPKGRHGDSQLTDVRLTPKWLEHEALEAAPAHADAFVAAAEALGWGLRARDATERESVADIYAAMHGVMAALEAERRVCLETLAALDAQLADHPAV